MQRKTPGNFTLFGFTNLLYHQILKLQNYLFCSSRYFLVTVSSSHSNPSLSAHSLALFNISLAFSRLWSHKVKSWPADLKYLAFLPRIPLISMKYAVNFSISFIELLPPIYSAVKFFSWSTPNLFSSNANLSLVNKLYTFCLRDSPLNSS